MRIGIIGAMDVEIAVLLEQMQVRTRQIYANMTFHAGTLGTADIVVVKSGVGKVNAALCVQLLVDHFSVTHVINTGVAGSLCSAIDIGDLVVSTSAGYHDVDATVFGYQRGEIPQLGIVSFPADRDLRARAAAAAAQAAPDMKVFEGQVISGDQFISSHAGKEDLMHSFSALCAEMEGAAIAQACWLNQIPWVILRAISDKADESVSVSYEEFEAKAARNCAAITAHMVRSF